MKKQKFSETHVDVHDDGSATIHHVHASNPAKDVKHAVADLDGVHDSMEEHLNPNEEDALEEEVHPGIHHEIMALKDKE